MLLVGAEDGRVEYANPAFLQRTGLAPVELGRALLADLFPGESAVALRGVVGQVGRTGVPEVRGGLACVRPGREPLAAVALVTPAPPGAAGEGVLPAPLVLVHLLTPAAGAEDEVPGGAGPARDLRQANTALLLAGLREQEGAELALRQAQELRTALAASLRLAAAAQSASDFIALADAHGRALFLNAAAQQLLGIAPAEAVEGAVSLADVLEPEDRERFRGELLPAALERGRWVGELHVGHRESGALTPLHCSLFPVVDGRTGEQLGVGLVGRDISDLKRQEAVARERAELERRLIGIVSHDLRDPLAAIQLAAEALLGRLDGRGDARAESLARNIHAVAERTGRMVVDLLDFTLTRMVGGLPIRVRALEFQDAVSEVVQEARLAHPGCEVRLEKVGGGLGWWDPDRLSQALHNLLSNALQYGPPGAPVTVRTRGGADWVECDVHNPGEPIPEDLLPVLFEPLRRGERGGGGHRKGGKQGAANLGLGLYIVEHITRGHGGSVRVTSSAAEGTTFTLRLPREPHTPQGPQGPQGPAAAPGGARGGR
jgi:PAS domain S-box-containing protein